MLINLRFQLCYSQINANKTVYHPKSTTSLTMPILNVSSFQLRISLQLQPQILKSGFFTPKKERKKN